MASSHPKVERRGTAPNFTLVLTDPDGNDLMTSGEYATAALAQTAARLLEDSARYALPLPLPPE